MKLQPSCRDDDNAGMRVQEQSRPRSTILPPPMPAANGNDDEQRYFTSCCPACGAVDKRPGGRRSRASLRGHGLKVSPDFGRCFGCANRLEPHESHRSYCDDCVPSHDTLPPVAPVSLTGH